MELQNMTIRKNPAIIRQNAAKEENLVLVRVVLRMTEGMTRGLGTGVAGVALATPRFLDSLYNFF